MKEEHQAWLGALAVFLFYVCAIRQISRSELLSAPDPPRMVLRVVPQLALSSPGVGGAAVTIYVRLEGRVTEEWYCPEVVWEWPDGTVSKRESDCDPWEDGLEGETRWSQTRGFPSGEWPVTVEFRKSGKLVAKQVATVRVVG